MQFHSHDGTWQFLRWSLVAILLVLAVWWLESRFGSGVAIMVLGGTLGVVVFAGGAMLALAVQKNTMQGIAKFNHDDAQVDRYRMQSFKALASGDAAMKRASAQLQVIDAKRVNQLAQQQAKLLTDAERAKQQAQNELWVAQNKQDVWADTEDEDSFAGW